MLITCKGAFFVDEIWVSYFLKYFIQVSTIDLDIPKILNSRWKLFSWFERVKLFKSFETYHIFMPIFPVV